MNVISARWSGVLGIAAFSAVSCSADEPSRPKSGVVVNVPISAGAAAPASGFTAGTSGSLTGPASTLGGAGTSAPAAPPPVSADCNPADKKPDPTRVPFTQLSGYQRLSKEPTTGPHKPVIETDASLPEWTIYRPETFDDGPHPILAWAQGGCLKNGTLYGQWLLELASYGYIVMSDGPPTLPTDDPAAAGFNQGAGGKPQLTAIEWVIAENDRPCSVYYHKVTVAKLAVTPTWTQVTVEPGSSRTEANTEGSVGGGWIGNSRATTRRRLCSSAPIASCASRRRCGSSRKRCWIE